MANNSSSSAEGMPPRFGSAAVRERHDKIVAAKNCCALSESPRVLCPKSIREYSLHVCVRDSWLKSPRVSWDRCNLVLFLQLSSSAPMLQRHVARHPS
ncbi:hypothetical protein V6N12_050942 [Hibiscus sabdariffa]|uniref:Uncharacterized protein n=1 Tax=Hibiscus sabdariffa TaxID=183260 RepID=A0ABR2GE91_9ROSI